MRTNQELRATAQGFTGDQYKPTIQLSLVDSGHVPMLRVFIICHSSCYCHWRLFPFPL